MSVPSVGDDLRAAKYARAEIPREGVSTCPSRDCVPAGATLRLTAEDLEAGAVGIRGRLGDGRVNWRFAIRSDGELSVMNLLESPGGHVSTLSTSAPAALRVRDVHTLPLLPSAVDASGREGLVRVANLPLRRAMCASREFDDAGRAYDALNLPLGAGETRHFDSNDLELGDLAKGISGHGIRNGRLAPGAVGRTRHRSARIRPHARRYDVSTFNREAASIN